MMKMLMPIHMKVSKRGIEIGNWKIPFRRRPIDNNEDDESLMPTMSELPNLQLMSMQFCSFLARKKTKNKIYSYLDPM